MVTNLENDQDLFLTNDISLTNGAHILYVYEDEKKYIENVVSFLSVGLKLNQLILCIEDTFRLKQIAAKLIERGFSEQQVKSIQFVVDSDFYIEENSLAVSSVIYKLEQIVRPASDEGITVRTWGNVRWTDYDYLAKKVVEYEEEANKFLAECKTISVCAYDGKELPANMLLALAKSHDRIMSDDDKLFSVGSDKILPSISVQESLEDALIQIKKYKRESKKVERLNAISQLASSISHEVRNPLTTVSGFLQLFKQKDEYAQDQHYLDLMIGELNRASSLISEFLSLGKFQQTELKKENLNQIIRTILPLISAKAVESSKEIVSQLSTVPEIMLDAQEIRQVLLNLIQNGLESMPAGGKVFIKTTKTGKNVILTVKDEGCGIPDHLLDKVGTPFFTTKKDGTGLGLSTCFSILERHNADVKLESGAEGTTFTMVFRSC